MSFVLPIRPPRSSRAPKTPKAIRTTKTLQPPPESPRRRPSLATRAGVVKRRSSVSTSFNAPSMSFFEAMFGDDFPDTFVLGDGRSCKSKKTLFDLPAEILEIVYQSLSATDVKRLRLTSRELAETVELRMDRVFISPNRANLDCLNNILNHDRYRSRVQEIVWDDAQLDEYGALEQFKERLDSDQEKARIALEDHLSTLFQDRNEEDTSFDSIGIRSCMDEDGTLTQLGKAILLSADDQKSKNIIESHAAPMSIEESYDLYQKLYQDEKEIIKRGWDVSGLQRALTQLPNLQRVTLTSEVWRPWYHLPTYDTPFYRALPAGFRKPSVWPWVSSEHLSSVCTPIQDRNSQHLPTKWRGYSVVMGSLATNPVPNLQEFALDTGLENIGLPDKFFILPNVDYTNTIHVLSTAPIRRFRFSYSECNTALRNRDSSAQASADVGLFRHIIAAMPLLEHLHLTWRQVSTQAHAPLPSGLLQQVCPGLRHLSLRHTNFTGSWLYTLITELKSLETVVLDKITLTTHEADEGTVCEELFSRLRDHFAATSRRGPRFTWIDPIQDQLLHTYKQWVVVDDELNAFLYDGGDSPWIRENSSGQLQTLKHTVGWVMDGRDPSYRKRRSDMPGGHVTRQRNPWPVDGAMADTPPDWRMY